MDPAVLIPESVMPAGGLWMKTHFYQEGPMLKSTTTCVTCGDVEVLKFEVDLRPIAKAAVDYHNALHARNQSRPAGLKSSVGVDVDDELVGYDEVIAGCGFNPACHIRKAARKVKKAVRKVVAKVKKIAKSKLIKKIGRGLKKFVKKVGSHLKTFSGFDLVKGLVKGERIDRALMNNLKAAVKDVKSNAKYAQMVASVVPGLGTGVAAGIAGAAALAEGKRIDDVLIAATKGALPGGPIAAAAFDTAVGLAKGKRIDKALLGAARNRLPTAARRAFDTGVAIAHGRSLQKVIAATGVASRLPSFKMPKMSGPAAKAYSASSKMLSRLENGASAKRAVRNVRKSRGFMKKIRVAMRKVGKRRTTQSLRRNPALARKARNAMLVAAASKRINPRNIRRAISGEKKALNQMARIVKATQSPNKRIRDAAKKSLAVLKVVAQERSRVAAVVEANQGGRPGMYIDRSGRILRGNFTRQVSSTAAKGVLYTREGVDAGHFTRLPSPQPVRRAPRRAQPSAVAMRKLAEIARRAKGGDRKAQAQLAALKRMAAGRARVSGNEVGAMPSLSSAARTAARSVAKKIPSAGFRARMARKRKIAEIARLAKAGSPKARAILAKLKRRKLILLVSRARRGDRRAQAQLAALKRQARGGKRSAQAKLARAKGAMRRARVSGNAAEEITETIESYRDQRALLDSDLDAINSPEGDNELTALIGCPPNVGDDFNLATDIVGDDFDSADLVGLEPEKIVNVVGARRMASLAGRRSSFKKIAKIARLAQRGDPRARRAIQRVAKTLKGARVRKLAKRAKIARICARLSKSQKRKVAQAMRGAFKRVAGDSPLPEPPPGVDFLVNGPAGAGVHSSYATQHVVGPPMIGCPPMPVGVNPLEVGSQYWARPRHGTDAEGRAHMPDVADVVGADPLMATFNEVGRNLARNSAQYWSRDQRNLDDVVGCPPAPVGVNPLRVGMASSTPIPSVLV